ncbi:LacI family transcriptional regulator [Sporosarcina sp. NCCP-2716]|uniref:LacI family DNA-binding transcriptional regulator n=1 Tax=Sporosarcina sp. NCCP-2716 TaxID=2943679 RepID=UPI00203DC07F|nr:LacI family DNA-binding transcriptional regulator [Sporosarcina sp. NCCP-2716]GKV70151.1 LacI family transcriptional regulator [Sporosarcina sp. NCCP-2716]
MKTIQDIAKLANVSKSTVSRYLNGGSVSKAMQAKLSRIIEETGYRPNKFAQSLRAKRTGMIGAIVPRLTSRSAMQTLSGLDMYLRDRSHQLLIVNADLSADREIEGLYAMAKQKVDGIVLFATAVTYAHIDAIEEIGIPVILLGQRHPSVPSLAYDDYQAGRDLADYVAAQGYRQAAYIGVGPEVEAIGVLRRKGVEDGLAAGGVQFTSIEATFEMESAAAAAEQLLRGDAPDLIMCATDDLALGVLKATREAGLRVPEDIGITGFGGYSPATYLSPGLTTIRFHFREAGAEAGRALLDLMSGEQPADLPSLQHELLIQESAVKIC